MENPNVLQVPQIDPFQFASDGAGTDNSVNLFRGDASFNIPLFSRKGQNGLDVQVNASYRSNVFEAVKKRNLEVPTSILGLGWSMPIDRIEANASGTGSEDNKYYFVNDETKSRLYRNNRRWLRAVIDTSFMAVLDSENFIDILRDALQSQSLRISPSSAIKTVTSGQAWTITDRENEFTLSLEAGSDSIQVYDGGKSYELQGFDYSRIRYYKEFEKWEITTKDGHSQIFGGNVSQNEDGLKTSLYNSVLWGVSIGNWHGASRVTRSASGERLQSQYAKAWYFTATRSLWDDKVTFSYEQVTQKVGSEDGLPYTKAVYLSKITDVYGKEALFHYNEKTYDNKSSDSVREYADPYKQTPDNTPDAFQSCYETRYLDSIEVYNGAKADGNLTYTLSFGYELNRYISYYDNPSQARLNGDTYKRTLTTIKKVLSTGSSFPSVKLAYHPSNALCAGALCRITYPEGSTVSYEYGRSELAHCSRDLKIATPALGSTPRVWFGYDYSVVTWYNNGALTVSVYTWVGHWQKWTPSKPTIMNADIDLDTYDCLTENDYFALHYKQTGGQSYQTIVFHKDPRILGAWLEYNQAQPVHTASSDALIASGENFFVIADQINKNTDAYTWNALEGTWEKSALPDFPDLKTWVPAGNSSDSYLFMTGVNNVLTGFIYDKIHSPGTKRNALFLYYLDEAGVWQKGETLETNELKNISVFPSDITTGRADLSSNWNWSVTPWNITATYVTSCDAASVRYNVSVIRWGADDYKLTSPFTKSFFVRRVGDTGAVTVPFAARCTSGGLLASGSNLMRFNGKEWMDNNNLALRTDPDGQNFYWFTVGNDLVIKTENTPSRIIGQVQTFDPNTESEKWGSQAVTLLDSAPVGDRLTGYFSSFGRDVITWNTDFYQKEQTSDWKPSLKVPFYNISAGSDTSTLINRAQDFMVYLEKGTDRKTITGTRALYLENGTVASSVLINERFFSFTDSSGKFVSGINGRMPGAGDTFLTYLPLNGDFDKAQSVTLRRFIGQSLQSPVVHYPVIAVRINDGFQVLSTRYEFDINNAVCDAFGTTAKYYQTTVSKGSDRENGYTVYCFFNSHEGLTQNLTTRTCLDGTLRSKQVYDAGNKLVQSGLLAFETLTAVPEVPGGEAAPIYGTILQMTRMTDTKDGLQTESTTEYDPFSGNPCKAEQTGNFNGNGEAETYRTYTTFGHETDDALRRLNSLDTTVQTKKAVTVNGGDEITVSCEAATIKLFEKCTADDVSLPDGHETHTWLGNGSNDTEDKWLKTSRIESLSKKGNPLLIRDMLSDKVASFLYKKDESAVIAEFHDADIRAQEAFYCGFEAYENLPEQWKPTDVTDALSHTGTRCMRITGTKEPLRLTPAKGREYLFSCWVKYSGTGNAGWNIALNGKPAGTGITFAASPSWTFYYWRATLADNAKLEFTPYCESGEAFCDNIGFAPFNSPFSAKVYSEKYDNVTEEVGSFNSVSRYLFDALERPLAATGHFDDLTGITSSRLSRQNGDDFNAAEPNATVIFKLAGDTRIDRFRNNGGLDDWQTGSVKWKSEKGFLIHGKAEAGATEEEEEILFSPSSFGANYVVHAGFPDADTELKYPAGIRIGNTVIRWLPQDKKWELSVQWDGDTPTYSIPCHTPGKDWLLALTRKCLLFYADGRLLFNYIFPENETIAGAFTLFALDEVRFNNFFIGLQPQASAKFYDAGGKILQTQSLEGNEVTVMHTLYDTAGLSAVTTMPARLGETETQLGEAKTWTLLTYMPDAVRGMDWKTGRMTGRIADSLPESKGYPYSRRLFEPSPLARPLQIGAPGKDYAITGNPAEDHVVRYTYTVNDGSEDPIFSEKQYLKTVRRDPNGNDTYSLSDKLGNEVLSVILLEGGAAVKTVSQIGYTDTGKTLTTLLPNYFNPPAGSGKDRWKRVAVHDIRDRKISFTEPNSGTSRFIYNDKGQLRFSQNTEQMGRGFIVYQKYDAEDRPLEDGYYYTKNWDNDYLQSKAEDSLFPSKTDVEGLVVKRSYQYNGISINDFASLTGTVTHDEEGTPETTTLYAYDDRRHIRSKTVNDKQTAAYTYDNLGQVESTTYPSGRVLVNSRDEFGRVVKVKEVKDEQDIPVLSLTYTPGGRTAAQDNYTANATVPVRTDYAYNPQGWLTGTTTTGAGGKQLLVQTIKRDGRYNGIITSKEAVHSGGKKASYTYGYDNAYRVKNVGFTLNGEDRSIKNITYDANGNFLAVDNEAYSYDGTDFVTETSAAKGKIFKKDHNGAVFFAEPRNISRIDRNIYSGKPDRIETDSEQAFIYDAAGKRLRKKTGDYTKLYERDPSGRILTETKTTPDGSAVIQTTDYIYGPGGIVGVLQGGKRHVVLNDHLNTPVQIVNAQGNTEYTFFYDPFGKWIGQTDEALNILPYLFNGYELDRETGLYNASARLYDPALRRFYCTDPQWQFASPYLFAGGNPANMIDPNGELSKAAMGGAIAGGIVIGIIAGALTFGIGSAIAAGIIGSTEATAAITAANIIVGTVSGTVGSVASGASTAGMTQEPYTGMQALTDSLSGAVGGCFGAAAGALAVKATVKVIGNALGQMSQGIYPSEQVGRIVSRGIKTGYMLKAAHIGAGFVSGAAGSAAGSGVASAMTGQAFFRKETAVNIAIGAIAGTRGFGKLSAREQGTLNGYRRGVFQYGPAPEMATAARVNARNAAFRRFQYFVGNIQPGEQPRWLSELIRRGGINPANEFPGIIGTMVASKAFPNSYVDWLEGNPGFFESRPDGNIGVRSEYDPTLFNHFNAFAPL